MDISNILESSNNFADNAQKAGQQLFDLNLDSAAIESNSAKLYQSIGANSNIIDSAKQNADLATQNARIAGANALGTNLKAQGEVLTGLSTDILSLMGQKRALAATIAQKQSVGFFDDPLQHIINQFTINDDIDKHNAVNEQLVSEQDQVETLNKLTQSTNVTQNQLNEPITAAAIAASASNTAATATINANKASQDALKYNAQGITAALGASKEALGAQFNAVTAQNQQQNIQIALDHLALARQEFDWKKEEKKIADEARAKNASADDYMLDKVNDGLVRMGMAPIPKTSPKAGNILGLIKTGSPAAGLYAEAFQVSNDSELAGGATILAPSPSRAAELFKALPNIKLSPAQLPVKDIIDSAASQVMETVKSGQINGKDKAVTDAAMKEAATSILSGYAKKIVPGDQSNPFQIPGIGALINAAPGLQTLPVISKVIAPIIASGADVSDPNKVYGAALAAVQEGTISVPEAIEGIAQLYRTGVKVNLEARQFQSLGMNLNPKKPGDASMMTFNAPIQINTAGALGFGVGKTIVDLTDEVSISRAFNKSLAAQSLAGMIGN